MHIKQEGNRKKRVYIYTHTNTCIHIGLLCCCVHKHVYTQVFVCVHVCVCVMHGCEVSLRISKTWTLPTSDFRVCRLIRLAATGGTPPRDTSGYRTFLTRASGLENYPYPLKYFRGIESWGHSSRVFHLIKTTA